MPPFIYQVVINLIVRLPIRRSANALINIAMCEHCTLGSYICSKWQNLLLKPDYYYY